MIDFVSKQKNNWKKLTASWENTSNNWDDDQFAFFNKKYWQPLTNETRSIINVSAKLVDVIEAARRNVK